MQLIAIKQILCQTYLAIYILPSRPWRYYSDPRVYTTRSTSSWPSREQTRHNLKTHSKCTHRLIPYSNCIALALFLFVFRQTPFADTSLPDAVFVAHTILMNKSPSTLISHTKLNQAMCAKRRPNRVCTYFSVCLISLSEWSLKFGSPVVSFVCCVMERVVCETHTMAAFSYIL